GTNSQGQLSVGASNRGQPRFELPRHESFRHPVAVRDEQNSVGAAHGQDHTSALVERTVIWLLALMVKISLACPADAGILLAGSGQIIIRLCNREKRIEASKSSTGKLLPGSCRCCLSYFS